MPAIEEISTSQWLYAELKDCFLKEVYHSSDRFVYLRRLVSGYDKKGCEPDATWLCFSSMPGTGATIVSQIFYSYGMAEIRPKPN